MPTILHVTEALDRFGGTPRKLLMLAKASRGSGWRHAFLTFFPGNLDESFRAEGCSVINVGSANPAAICRALLVQVRRLNADAVSTHFSRALFCAAATKLIHRRPIVHNEHGVAELIHPRGRAARVRVQIRGLAARSARAVICNSEYTRGHVVDIHCIESRRAVVVVNPVERRVSVNTGSPSSEAIVDSASTVVGHVGGMIRERDQATLLRAIEMLRREGRNVAAVLIGEGPCREELESEAENLGISKAVHFVGYQSDVGGWLRIFDVYVNPTLCEGFGIAVVEAMLEGVPVVAANAGAHPEIIDEGRTGMLFRPGDAVSLAGKLSCLLDNKQLAKELGGAGARVASVRYSVSTYCRKYHDAVLKAVRP